MDSNIIKRFKKLDIYQNKISAKVFDTISNISTVLILRIEKLVLRSIGKKIDEHRSAFDSSINYQNLQTTQHFIDHS